MKENIEKETNLENFKLLISNCKEHRKLYNESFVGEYDIKIMDNILSDYKRVLKENEELKESNKILQECYWNECVSKQKIKDKIEYIEKEGYWLFSTDRDSDKCVEVLKDLLEEKGE